MTDIEFRNLCRDDYRKQLENAGYPKKEIDEFAEQQEKYFREAIYFDEVGGGILYLKRGNTAFVFYIYIYDIWRKNGLATKALHLFYDWAKNEGITKIQLNVFDHNKPAKRLYKDFRVISSLMEKQL